MAKILLVEDDNNLREIYEARLQAEGYQIVAANDGEAALVIAKSEKPDLIISDVMMPKISGFEMLDILRNTDELKATKVIMLTALGQADDQSRADKLGADRYLVKSQVTLEDIVRVSHELLGDLSIDVPAEPAPSVAPTPPAPPAPTAVPVTPAPEVPTPTIAVATPPDAAPPAQEPPATTIPVSVAPEAIAPTPAPAPVPEPVTVPIETSAPVAVEQPTAVPVAPVSTPPTEPATRTLTMQGAQSSADEEATVTKQIEDFVAASAAPAADPTTPVAPVTAIPVATPSTAPTTDAVNDDKMLADAVSDLVTSTSGPALSGVATPPSPVQAPATDAPVTPSAPVTPVPEASGDAAPVAHKKVIQPIAGEPKPDLDALLAAEEAKEQPATQIVVSSIESTPPPPPAPATSGPVPGSSIPPASNTGIDPNSIAL
ncbi:MAG TPA: response regulator [Candidatus Saccharimonadales bacterium]|nr:response regulator [Candidatus Saccharimonadales bacterium]